MTSDALLFPFPVISHAPAAYELMITRLTTYDHNVSAYACVYVLPMLSRVLVYLCSAVLVIAGRIAIGRRCLIYLRCTVDAITYMCRFTMNEMGQNVSITLYVEE